VTESRKRVTIPIRAETKAELPPDQRAAVLDAVQKHRSLEGALLPILHGVQDRLGWVPPAAVALIALELNITRAEVHGVLTFYHYFRQRPAAAHTIYLCRAEACQALGANGLAAHAERALGAPFHQCSADGRFGLEPVYCLGNCAMGPSLLIDRQLYSRVTAERFDAIIQGLSGGVDVPRSTATAVGDR
jgi:formate dehydrogenase subunit gamma